MLAHSRLRGDDVGFSRAHQLGARSFDKAASVNEREHFRDSSARAVRKHARHRELVRRFERSHVACTALRARDPTLVGDRTRQLGAARQGRVARVDCRTATEQRMRHGRATVVREQPEARANPDEISCGVTRQGTGGHVVRQRGFLDQVVPTREENAVAIEERVARQDRIAHGHRTIADGGKVGRFDAVGGVVCHRRVVQLVGAASTAVIEEEAAPAVTAHRGVGERKRAAHHRNAAKRIPYHCTVAHGHLRSDAPQPAPSPAALRRNVLPVIVSSPRK